MSPDFPESIVRDAAGEGLRVLYHGTGNMASIDAFDPAMTGHGNDQSGSGFYFTDRLETAESYTLRRVNSETPKMGGEDDPGVICVHLDLRKPIVVAGDQRYFDRVQLSVRTVRKIILASPFITNRETTPLWNWIDINGMDDAALKRAAADLAVHYCGEATSLFSLENDFYPGRASEFRAALRDATGYDGVIVHFDDETHYVAWFPEQIAIVDRMPRPPVSGMAP